MMPATVPLPLAFETLFTSPRPFNVLVMAWLNQTTSDAVGDFAGEVRMLLQVRDGRERALGELLRPVAEPAAALFDDSARQRRVE